jgi:hypothetical protein
MTIILAPKTPTIADLQNAMISCVTGANFRCSCYGDFTVHLKRGVELAGSTTLSAGSYTDYENRTHPFYYGKCG